MAAFLAYVLEKPDHMLHSSVWTFPPWRFLALQILSVEQQSTGVLNVYTPQSPASLCGQAGDPPPDHDFNG
jgi:hypothetical protein